MFVQEESKSSSSLDENQDVLEDTKKFNAQTIQLASKQFEDILQFQEPSTSKNMTVKTEIRINIVRERENQADDSYSQISLPLMRERINNNNIHVQKTTNEKTEESYHTIDTCVKDKNVNTILITDPNIERIRAPRGEIPPPYEPSHPPPAYSSFQMSPDLRIQPRWVPVQTTEPIYDASRTPTYRMSSREPYHPYDNDPFASSSGVFQDRTIRNKFVQKVYAILSIQLLFSFGFVLLCILHKPTGIFMRTRIEPFLFFLVFWLVLYSALMCYKACRRIFPLNLILLTLFTMCQAYILGATSVWYSTHIVLITLGATAAICLLVSFIACQNWFDITKWGFILAITGIVVMIFGFIAMLITLVAYSNIAHLIFAGLATGLFTMYLLYDTQCILGGRRVEMSPEEHILGVMTLYVDICLIFMYMVQLIDACR